MKKTIAEISKETLAVEEFIRTLSADETATYLEIEQATGVRMDARGRARIAVATKRAGAAYACIKGFGIKMAGPMTGRDLVMDRTARIDSAVKRAERIAAIVMARHRDGMPASDRQQVELTSATFAMIRVLANDRKRELKLARKDKPPTVMPRSLQDVCA